MSFSDKNAIVVGNASPSATTSEVKPGRLKTGLPTSSLYLRGNSGSCEEAKTDADPNNVDGIEKGMSDCDCNDDDNDSPNTKDNVVNIITITVIRVILVLYPRSLPIK
jgi:hypothetical protein